MTRLDLLEAELVRHERRQDTWTMRRPDGTDADVTGPRDFIISVAAIAEAQGVCFLCPLCFAANGGAIGTHSVICWSRSRGIADDVHPGPGRWSLHGSGIDDLTLDADPPGGARSVLLTSGCGWHGFVNSGDAT